MGHPMVPKITIAVRSNAAQGPRRVSLPSSAAAGGVPFPAVGAPALRQRSPFAGRPLDTPELLLWHPARDRAPRRERFRYAGLLPGRAAWSFKLRASRSRRCSGRRADQRSPRRRSTDPVRRRRPPPRRDRSRHRRSRCHHRETLAEVDRELGRRGGVEAREPPAVPLNQLWLELPCRSIGTSSSIEPASVSTRLRLWPLRWLPASRPASPSRWASISASSARSPRSAADRPSTGSGGARRSDRPALSIPKARCG